MIGEQIGNFKLISVLGQGGMGEVWLGEHAAIGTKVAIKMLLPHISANKEHVERFFNEAIAVGKISHAGIVKIFDVGFHNGRAYLVMEFMNGESLAARIRRLGRLPLAMVSEIGRQISGVLEAVHKAGITHRDLKPDNIFLVPDDELASGERVKVLDFGIAKLSGAGGGLTATASGSMGTPAYMSPEQWKNSKAVDWRADAYSLGCLAFEMASGGPPFPAETIGEACSKHLTEEPPRLASHVAVPAALDQLVTQLLAKLPDQRPPSMREIATRFGALATVNPIGLATTQMSGHVAIPQASGQLPAPSSSMPVPRNAPTQQSGPLARPVDPGTPTPMPMHPVTTLGGAAGSALVTAAPKRRGLMWALIGAGAALVIVVVVLAMSLGGGSGKKKHRDDDSASASGSDAPQPVVAVAPKSPVVEAAPSPSPPPPPPPPPKEEPKPVAGTGSAASKPAPAAVANGFLTVASTPFATIFVDGKRMGETPLVSIKLPVGHHKIHAVTADGAAKDLVVDIVADQTVKRQFTFEPAAVAGGEVANKPAPSQTCDMDEVACLVADKPSACCAKFKKGVRPAPVEKPTGDLPETIDRGMISQGMGPVKAKVMACGDKSQAKGTVRVGIKVSPDGSVAAVTIKQTPDAALGNCVASAVRSAHFPKTQTGGSFGFPFVF